MREPTFDAIFISRPHSTWAKLASSFLTNSRDPAGTQCGPPADAAILPTATGWFDNRDAKASLHPHAFALSMASLQFMNDQSFINYG